MEAGIRPREVIIKDNTQIYLLDQLSWFNDGWQHIEDAPRRSGRSAVSFIFPCGSGLSGAELLVLGCETECEAYFISVDAARKNMITKVFNYSGHKNPDLGQTKLKEIPENKVFTTSETPFLYRGEKSENFCREYRFPLFGSEMLKVIAQRGEHSRLDKMTLTYCPDIRNDKPKNFARIARDNEHWFLE